MAHNVINTGEADHIGNSVAPSFLGSHSTAQFPRLEVKQIPSVPVNHWVPGLFPTGGLGCGLGFSVFNKPPILHLLHLSRKWRECVCSFALWKKSVKCPLVLWRTESFSSFHSEVLIAVSSDLNRWSGCMAILWSLWIAVSFAAPAPVFPRNAMGRCARQGRPSHRHPELGEDGEVARAEGRLLFPGRACGSLLWWATRQTQMGNACVGHSLVGAAACEAGMGPAPALWEPTSQKRKKKDSKYIVYF